MEKPVVSIIIPTYNEEKHLASCLQSIYQQDFSRKSIEIIIIDDGSTDETIRIAKKYSARIVHSGHKHIERSKSMGIQESKGKYLFFIDADIRLIDKNIISSAVNLLDSNNQIVAAQCIYWHYDKKHSIVNRYCELFGINDPLPYYLKKRGIRSFLDNGWIYPDTLIKETTLYYLTQFHSNNLPTLGSQGYLCRSNSIRQYTHWHPYFFHLDATKELVDKNFNTFAMLKRSVEHDYVDSIGQFYKKLYRNLELFYTYRSYRTYDYDIKPVTFFIVLIQMMTVIRPLIDSVRGYIKKPDIAWFLHPIFCITVPILYIFVTFKYIIGKSLIKKHTYK